MMIEVRCSIEAFAGSEREVLRLAAMAERNSEHGLAAAIVDRARAMGLQLAPVDAFEALPGRGVVARREGVEILVGTPRLLEERGIDPAPALQTLDAMQEEGRTAVLVAAARNLLGAIEIADRIREGAAAAVRRLQDMGVEVVLLTGDSVQAARVVGSRLGIERVLAGVLPWEKAEEIGRLQKAGHRVAMVGDGINDAPALTRADVGVAIGAGTDIALDAADVVLIHSRLQGVVDAFDVSRRSYRKTVQNLGLAFAFNGIGVPLAATGLVHPGWAMAAMAGSVSLVLANSFGGRLMRERHATRGSRSVAALMVAMALGLPGGMRAQALPFHTETAITTGFEESAARTFASFFGRSGLFRDGDPIEDPLARDLDVFVQPVAVLPYAITPMWTTRVVVPFVHKSMSFRTPDGVPRSYSTTDIGDILVDTKWVFLSRNRLGGTTRIGIEGGVKVPTGGTGARMPDGSRAPRPLQAGSGSWDIPLKALFTLTQGHVGVLANVGYRIRTAGEGFRAGNVFTYDAAVGLRFVPWVYRSLRDRSLVAYLELNGEVSGKSEASGVENPDSGGHVLFLSPDIQWIPTPWLLFEASVQFPVLQDLDGTQLEYDTRFQAGTRIRFSVFR